MALLPWFETEEVIVQTVKMERGSSLMALLAATALAGALIQLREGMLPAALMAGLLPLIVLGVCLLTVPALYVGGAVLGLNPQAREVVQAMLRGWGALAATAFGLAPLQLLVATTSEKSIALLLTSLMLLVACGFGVCRFAAELPRTRKGCVPLLLFGAWTLVSLVISANLFVSVVNIGGDL